HYVLILSVTLIFSFFFQAEDGIRDFHVTGVQTCALPISGQPRDAGHRADRIRRPPQSRFRCPGFRDDRGAAPRVRDARTDPRSQIGRASCRERVENSVVAVSSAKEETRTVTDI